MTRRTKIIIVALSLLLIIIVGTIIFLVWRNKTKTAHISTPQVDGTVSNTTVQQPIDTSGDTDYDGQEISQERQDISKYKEFADITQDIDYQNVKGEDMKLDLYLPKDKYKNKLDKSGPPLIIYVHGGGWVGGDKTFLDQVGGVIRLIKNGYAVASINYHLAPQYNYPTQLKDMELAITFLKANAQKYGYNATNIGLMSSSAGGQIVAQFVSLNTNPNVKVQVLVLVAPATNLYSDTWSHGMKQYIKQLMNGQSAAGASPINHISTNLPPIFIIQGDQDRTIKPTQTQEYIDKLKAAGVTYEYLIVQNAGHDFNNKTDEASIIPSKDEIGQQIVRFVNKYLR